MNWLAACYPLVCLLLGTVSGSASWWREAVMHLLAVLALMAAFWAAKRSERWPLVGGLFEPMLVLLFAVLAAGALRSPCAAASWRMLVLFASATAVFYLALGVAPAVPPPPANGHPQWVLPATGTAAALLGLLAYALGWTPRVAAPLGHHNYMAGFLLLHLPLAGAAAEAARSRTARVFWYAAAGFQALAILLTGSLAGVAVLALLGLPRLVAAFRRRELAFAVALPMAVLAAIAALFVWSQNPVIAGLRGRAAGLVGERRDPSLSLENRLRYLRAGLSMAAAHPLAGAGLASVPLVSALYREQTPGLSPPGEALRQLHNLPVNLLAEGGVLGLGAALLLALAALGGKAGAGAAAVWAYLLFSLNDYQLDVPAILFPLAIIAALAVAGTGAPAWPRSEPPALPRRLALVSLLGFALVGTVLFARSALAHYQYDRGNAAGAAQWDAHCGFYAFQAGSYVEAAERMPDMVPMAAQAGSSLLDAGQYRRSRTWLERAAALDYYHALAHFHLGRARLRTGDRAGAIEAFSTALLVQPVTVFAEAWREPPERDVYADSLERAIDKLYELAAFYPRSGPLRRWNELGSYLVGRRNLLPQGPHRVLFFEWMDRDLSVNHSLIVFRRAAPPVRVSPLVLLTPTPTPRPPAGIGAIAGLPSYRAAGHP